MFKLKYLKGLYVKYSISLYLIQEKKKKFNKAKNCCMHNFFSETKSVIKAEQRSLEQQETDSEKNLVYNEAKERVRNLYFFSKCFKSLNEKRQVFFFQPTLYIR